MPTGSAWPPSFPSHSQLAQPPVHWNASSPNGYSHYNSSAERSSAGSPYEHGAGVNGAAGTATGYSSHWQRPNAYLPPPASQAGSNQYPAGQYHYSLGSQSSHHRAP